MATESPVRMLESDESKKWPFNTIAGHEGLSKILNEKGVLGEQTNAMPNRSGSAPPTVEGSIDSLRTFMDQWNSPLSTSESGYLNFESEEQMRTDPSYIAYYYANVNLNPRLPPPLISRENRHLVRLMRDSGSKKLTSVTEVVLATHREEPEEDTSPRQTSSDVMKGDFPQATSSTAVKGENDHDICTTSTTDQSSKMQESCSGSANVHEVAHTIKSHDVASISSSDSPATTSHPGNSESMDNLSTRSDFGSNISALETRMESWNMSVDLVVEDNQETHGNVNSHYQNTLPCHPSQDPRNQVPGFQGNAIPQGMHGFTEKLPAIHLKQIGVQTFMHNPGTVGQVPPLYMATAAYMNSGNILYPIIRPPGFLNPQFMPTMTSASQPPYFGGYSQNAIPIDPYSIPSMFKQPIEGSIAQMNPYASQMLYLSKNYPLNELMMRASFNASLQGQYLQQPLEDARRTAFQQGQFDFLTLQKDSNIATLMGHKELGHLGNGNLGVSVPTNRTHISANYYGPPPSLGMPHFPTLSTVIPGSPMAGSNLSGPSNDVSVSQRSPRSAVSSPDWKGQRGYDGSDDSKRHSFLELVKSCNSRKLELSDISGKIVEFSADQHGSRFIQQKLEHCGIDEKESVFKEVIPHASKLMTDVFGNYVIQKFFEHGNAEQRRKLGEQLSGQILPLSLQMYGCRVIQKALEVIELDQKTELIQELDGHVMRCVHDQNGNHVIQKCIESVPAEKVGFIIYSFRGQVATLSSHPYGCRVIQRVLEHCSDEQICRWIVDEVLESACDLAQDPYGNYVAQHVLEMGKSYERGQIINRLAGKFVEMSQHKYASNVVEKCLKYGDSSERNLIIEEIVVQPSNDDALLKMMKDQFGNYVVQKIFDMGNDKQKDILLKCIHTHLPALKKFPYAKHIVTRYEQLSESSAEEQKH